MIVYKNGTFPVITSASSVTGVQVPQAGTILASNFFAWQPSTWPKSPKVWDSSLVGVIAQIFKDSMLHEIDNVIGDAKGDLRHRGHVITIALLCALDAVSSYGYGRKNGKQIPVFVRAHFPSEYNPHATKILKLYRHMMVHAWNLFSAAIYPGDDSVVYDKKKDILSFGVLNFRKALGIGIESYLKSLETDKALQEKTLKRYAELRAYARG